MIYILRFFALKNTVCFIILTYLVPVLFTFYIQGVLKLKKNNSGTKRLIQLRQVNLTVWSFLLVSGLLIPVNPLTPNDPYRGLTAPLTSKVAFYIFIQQIWVLNILNMVYTLRFFFCSKCSLFHNSNVFGSCIIHILYTGCAKIKKIAPAPNFNRTTTG